MSASSSPSTPSNAHVRGADGSSREGARGTLSSGVDVAPAHRHIVIIGAGFAGLGAAIKLLEAGERDFVVLEKGSEVGGCWRDNTYPGLQCDVQSNVYSFSFAQNPKWSRSFPWQAEIYAYLKDCADRFGVRPYLRLDTTVEAARWDEGSQRWRVETSAGVWTADFLIAGTGGLSEPSIPDLPGLESFDGPVFHSARWRHDVSLAGKRVAVIGTGATAIQVVPALQRQVAELQVFQRSAAWIFPRRDKPVSAWRRRLYERVPAAQKLARAWRFLWLEARIYPILKKPELMKRGEAMALEYMRSQVSDPELRRKLTPDYGIGCKRMLLSDDFYPAISAPNTRLIDSGIREVTARGIVDGDGVLHELDAIVLCTGFKTADHPVTRRLFGRDGRSLAEHWQAGAKAYLGTTVDGFPNFFMMTGPNSGLGHNSIVYIIEAQVAYILGALRAMRRSGAAALSVRRDVVERYNEWLQSKLAGTVWDSGCQSWYLDEHGRNIAIWPGFAASFRKRTARFDPESYELQPSVGARSAPQRAPESRDGAPGSRHAAA